MYIRVLGLVIGSFSLLASIGSAHTLLSGEKRGTLLAASKRATVNPRVGTWGIGHSNKGDRGTRRISDPNESLSLTR